MKNKAERHAWPAHPPAQPHKATWVTPTNMVTEAQHKHHDHVRVTSQQNHVTKPVDALKQAMTLARNLVMQGPLPCKQSVPEDTCAWPLPGPSTEPKARQEACLLTEGATASLPNYYQNKWPMSVVTVLEAAKVLTHVFGTYVVKKIRIQLGQFAQIGAWQRAGCRALFSPSGLLCGWPLCSRHCRQKYPSAHRSREVQQSHFQHSSRARLAAHLAGTPDQQWGLLLVLLRQPQAPCQYDRMAACCVLWLL